MPCASFAASYSAFSDKSPLSLASAICSDIAGRYFSGEFTLILSLLCKTTFDMVDFKTKPYNSLALTKLKNYFKLMVAPIV
jgi:hypothetical protein